MDLTKRYICVDLQKSYHSFTHQNIGLKTLEKLFRIGRGEEELISGAALARTFQQIMQKRGYFDRMPEKKKTLILHYNLSDVVNLYYILVHWHIYVRQLPPPVIIKKKAT